MTVLAIVCFGIGGMLLAVGARFFTDGDEWFW